MDKESLIIIITKIREYFNQIRRKTKRYDSLNWGFPFIAAFPILLFIAAVFLATSSYFASTILKEIISVGSAELIATLAYFALIIGVLFQLGNVNSNTVRETPARIKKLKFSLHYVFSGKNKKHGAAMYGSD